MSINLCALIQIAGVWDAFVKSYVEVSGLFINVYKSLCFDSNCWSSGRICEELRGGK